MTEKEPMVPELNEDTIKAKIYEIRNQKVMLDFDLAKIYGYETKRFNEQVKNNINKFPKDFMFQIDKTEMDVILKSKKSASSWGGSRKLPYAFTEQGIYMLMTVLKGDLATKQSIALIDAFKNMKDYITTKAIPNMVDIIRLTQIVDEHTKDIKDIKHDLAIVMENFIDPSTYKQFLILDGEKIEADVAYQEIYRKAKHSIYIIDDYIDAKTFKLLKTAKDKDVVIMTDNKCKVDVQMLLNDSGIKVKVLKNKRSHDRFIILDYNTNNEKIYLSGASSKDAGNKVTAIIRIDNTNLYHNLIDEMLEE